MVSGRDLDGLARLRQENIGRLCLRLFRGFNARAVEMLQTRGHAELTLAHTSLMINLDVDGTRIVDLAERAGMSKQAMGRLVQDLERVGYVKRSPDPADRRATRVAYTSEGLQFLRDAGVILRDIEGEYGALLGDQPLAQLRSLLLALVEHVES
jgi:DNA-binding MarR family transcriptional regulator